MFEVQLGNLGILDTNDSSPQMFGSGDAAPAPTHRNLLYRGSKSENERNAI
jgi:hypothetical protein